MSLSNNFDLLLRIAILVNLMRLKLVWDGSDLGDITKYYIDIKPPKEGTSGSVLKLKTKYNVEKCLAWKYSNDIPLIVDELKPIFGLNKIGRHKCSIEGVKMIIARRENKEENILKKEEGNIDQIRECIVFRHLFGIITSSDSLWYRPGKGVISFKELTIDLNKNTSQINKTRVNKWFDGDYDLVTETVIILLKRSSPEDYSLIKLTQLIRSKISNEINRINSEMSPIASCFMTRVQTYLSHATSENS